VSPIEQQDNKTAASAAHAPKSRPSSDQHQRISKFISKRKRSIAAYLRVIIAARQGGQIVAD
jgi:hypothetical protein